MLCLADGMVQRPLVLLPVVVLASISCIPPAAPRHKGGIDPSTGVYTREDEDLVVPDVVPLVLCRTYLSGDRVSRHFGVGTTHPGEWYLIGDGATFQWAELILSTGGRIHFDRVSAGNAAADAVFEHRATPTRFLGARLRYETRGWLMTFMDGGTALFRHCNPNNSDVCSILETRDKAGHGIRYVRDDRGRLLQMQGETQKIVFHYDAQSRIDHAEDSAGHTVDYSYDEHGRLRRVRGADGTLRRYDYTDRDEMAEIEEPAFTIENWYGSGRVVRQRITYPSSEQPDVIRFAYTVRNGAVVQTDITEFDGTITRTRYNEHHYRLLEILDAEGERPLTVTYDRDSSNVARMARAQCRDGRERTVDFRALKGDGPEPDGWFVVERACGGRH